MASAVPRDHDADMPSRPRNARQHREKTQAASQNHAKARCNLGIMFASGIGVQRDDSKAARYYLAAATGGVPRAMFDLAVLYARGRGVLKDDVAAVAWCERAGSDGATCPLCRQPARKRDVKRNHALAEVVAKVQHA